LDDDYTGSIIGTWVFMGVFQISFWSCILSLASDSAHRYSSVFFICFCLGSWLLLLDSFFSWRFPLRPP